MRKTDFYIVLPRGVLGLGPYHVAVYSALRSFADSQSDECWPSHRAISERAGVSLNTAKRVLRDLRDEGWIGWEERRQQNGSLTSNLYQVYGSKQGSGRASVSHISATPSPHERAKGVGPQRAEVGPVRARELITKELEPKKELRVAPDGDDATRLAFLLSELLTDLGVKHRISAKWTRDLDLMIRKDGRTPAEIEAAMRWALADDFWSANIHSPAALRKQFDRMRLQAGRGKSKSNSEKAAALLAKYQMEGQS